MQAASSPLRESWQYDTEKQCLIFVWKNRIVHNKKWRNVVMPGLCSKYDSTSLYFSVKALLIQQIGSMRAVIKGQGLGIFSCYYKHDSTSLYFSVKALLIQQIGSMRAVIKGQGLGIFSCYYKHDPQLFS